ncbi:putative C1 family cathepsin B20 [Paratrimastix pyriformis]|uniref:C1 family cathepsin B20 n=1 Tax=Paratrimastix pyriformis TaxID=342808 RepID=A0ABQ8UIH0_9EUKA|nr:putative C1 family cathepsin B20 [Paratrimastix pyriformis]
MRTLSLSLFCLFSVGVLANDVCPSRVTATGERKYFPNGALPTPENIKQFYSKVDSQGSNVVIPDSFDLRAQFPECVSLTNPLNQQTCGSCWTFSSTGAAADRACIAEQANTIMAPQYQLSCDRSCFSGSSLCQAGCKGGYLALAFAFQKANGVVPQSCVAYQNQVTDCMTTCDDGSALKPIKPSTFARLTTVSQMQASLMAGGTLAAVYQVYTDNYDYVSGVYRHGVNETDGYHAIKIVGWGSEGGVPFWWIQNSWGPDFGLSGYFKMLRGSNECGIESDVWEVTIPLKMDACGAYTTCDNCTMHEDCGWCGSSHTCMSGNATAPTSRSATCAADWTTDTCLEDACSQFSASCDQCTLRQGCGWCVQSNGQATCVRGNAAGPVQIAGTTAAPTCARWDRQGGCVADPCASAANCTECGHRVGCGWCGDIAKCISGTSSTPSSGQCDRYVGNATFCPTDPCSNFGSCSACTGAGAAGLNGSHCAWCPQSVQCLSDSLAASSCPARWTEPSQCPLCASVSPADHTGIAACDACAAIAGCGWCASTQSCEVGAVGGPAAENTTCPMWSKAVCPGVCEGYVTCSTCALDASCGWCGARQTCMAGRQVATSSYCPHTWYEFKLQCPLDPSSGATRQTAALGTALLVALAMLFAALF